MVESVEESGELGNVLSILRKRGLRVPKKATNQLVRYVMLLREGNRLTQLVSRNDNARLISTHIAECFAPMCVFQVNECEKILDFGSGGGLPGVPWAILFPKKQFVLLESKKKKAAFLTHVKAQLDLDNVAVLPCHSDEINASHNHAYEIVIARAVARLSKLWKSCGRLLKNNGVLLAMKGGDLAPETAELLNLFPRLKVDIQTYPEELVPVDKNRRLVVVHEP